MQKVYKNILKGIAALVVIFSIASCIPQKKLLVLQEKEHGEDWDPEVFVDKSGLDGTYRIQTNDYLFIYITSVEGTNTDFFNMPIATNAGYTENNQMLVGYFVSDTGYIHFPFMGDIYVLGKTLDEAREILEKEVRKYVGEANVNVKLMNNTVSVMGEVNFQGTYRITKAKLTVIEALTLAGGFRFR